MVWFGYYTETILQSENRRSVNSGCAACEIHPVMKMEVDGYCPVGMPHSAFKMPNHSAFRKRIDSLGTLFNNAVSFSSTSNEPLPVAVCANDPDRIVLGETDGGE